MRTFRLFTIHLAMLLFVAAAFAAPDHKTSAPAVVSAKSVAVVSFDSSSAGESLKQKAAEFFRKWKRYQVVDDPQKADLIVLVGPMPRHVNSDSLAAVLDGKTPPNAIDTAGAQAQFAVFNGADMHNTQSASLQPLWSAELQGTDVITPGKKFREIVNRTTERAGNGGLANSDCYMLGLKTCR